MARRGNDLPTTLFDEARRPAPKGGSPSRGSKRAMDPKIDASSSMYAAPMEEVPYARRVMREAPAPETDPIRVLDLTRIAAVRLLQQQRETQRSYNFILSLKPEAIILRRNILESMTKWRQTTPVSGPHPHGPMARSVWFYMVSTVQHELDNMDSLTTGESTIKDFLRALKDTFYEATRTVIPAPSPIRTFRGLYKVGIVPAADRDVRYLFNFDHSTKDGRESHEELLQFLSNTPRGEIVTQLLNISLDLDKGIPDNLERSLRSADLRSASSLNYDGH